MRAQILRIIPIQAHHRHQGPQQNVCSLGQIQRWSHVLRTVANKINDDGNSQLANHFYSIHYAIGPDQAEEEFDPYMLDADYLITSDVTMEDFIWSLRMVLANGLGHIDPAIWHGGLQAYLRELLARLKPPSTTVLY